MAPATIKSDLPAIRSHESFAEHSAEPPRPPAASAAVQQQRAETEAYLDGRRTLGRHSVLRGLLWLAVVALVFSVLRAGADRAFYPGWWRQW